MKLFAVSDIHGHCTELKTALDEAGFDVTNKNHTLVVLGDMFDRGTENIMVYEFIKSLPRKILIKGNHEDFLCEIFEQGYITRRDVHNGTDITVEEMLGEKAIDGYGHIDRELYSKKINEITSFISSMQNYYETEKYVFVHGWVPITVEERTPHIMENWREATPQDWKEARLLEWQQLYSKGVILDGKAIVCGHRPSSLGSMFDDQREYDSSEIFYGKGMVAIDAYTVRSGRINVFVTEI